MKYNTNDARRSERLLPGYVLFFIIIICRLTMCRALFIRNEKADIIHRIPLITSSNQFSFPACTHLHPHHLPRYFTYYQGMYLYATFLHAPSLGATRVPAFALKQVFMELRILARPLAGGSRVSTSALKLCVC